MADIRRDRRPELQEPPPDRLVGCVNTLLGQQFLDIPKGPLALWRTIPKLGF